MNIDNINDEVTHDIENLGKKNEIEIQKNGKPLQQTRTIRRQNLRTWR
jgi:hypothetical protein